MTSVPLGADLLWAHILRGLNGRFGSISVNYGRQLLAVFSPSETAGNDPKETLIDPSAPLGTILRYMNC